MNIGRLGEIAQVAARHGFGYAVDGRRSRSDDETAPTARGRHLREMFDELGPTFVKFGQLLSTRPDVVPPDIIAELRRLQDDVSPFPFADVERVIREEFGQPIERLFLENQRVKLDDAPRYNRSFARAPFDGRGALNPIGKVLGEFGFGDGCGQKNSRIAVTVVQIHGDNEFLPRQVAGLS